MNTPLASRPPLPTTTSAGRTRTRRPQSRLVGRIAGIVVTTLTLLGLAGVAAAPASAVTWANSGANGPAYTYPTATGQYVTKARYGVLSTLPGVRVSAMVLGRSPATSGTQFIDYNIVVLRWNGTSWIKVTSDGTGTWRVPLTGAQTVIDAYYLQIGMTGYFRVMLGINWYDANHQFLGARAYRLDAAGDYGCNLIACQVGPSWIRL